MFKDSKAFSGFAVDDLAAARTFYTDKLGLEVTEAPETGLLQLHVAGGRVVVIYVKPDFVPATYTILNFPMADVEAAVDKLNATGIQMERYPEMDLDAKGIWRGGGPVIAWFKDPAGNILSVIEPGTA